MTKVSVIIPAYNETQTIGDLVSRIRNLYPDFEIIVIDDGSKQMIQGLLPKIQALPCTVIPIISATALPLKAV